MSATLYTASSPSPARHAGRGSAECTDAEGPVNLRHRSAELSALARCALSASVLMCNMHAATSLLLSFV